MNKKSNVNYEMIEMLALVGLVIVSIEIIVFKLWVVDLSVPFNYWGDSLWFIVPIKGMIENGWTFFVPQLSAPFGLSAAGFPSMTHFDWSVMWIISLFNKNAGAILNIFWLTSIVFTGWTATIAFNLLGIQKWLACGLAIVYAFLPYAFARNVAHISLVYYTVPLISILVIYIASGCQDSRSKSIQIWGYGALIIQGLNYIYFSFFSVLLLMFGGLLGYQTSKSYKPLKTAVLACAVLVSISSINLVPSFVSWSQFGKPPDMGYKTAAEAEVYGLKIRKMLAPNDLNQVPLFKQWGIKDKNSNFPNENENVSARLGPMASFGFVAMLLMSLGIAFRSEATKEQKIASLTLLCLLFATVGGLGAIFNQILADFRALNRFSVFIAFFSLAGIGLWWQRQVKPGTSNTKKITFYVLFVLLIAFSLYDQLLSAKHLRNVSAANEKIAAQEKSFIHLLTKAIPEGSSFFQLPMTNFPPDAGIERMLPYDHARAYLWSTNLNWSWPSFSVQHKNWQDQIKTLKGKDFLEELARSNFDFIWVDRFGYKDDGKELIASFLQENVPEIMSGESSRYVIFDLRKIKRKVHSTADSDLKISN